MQLWFGFVVKKFVDPAVVLLMTAVICEGGVEGQLHVACWQHPHRGPSPNELAVGS